MKRWLRPAGLLILLAALTARAPARAAEEAAGAPGPYPRGSVDVGVRYHRVTNDFGDWRGINLRAVALPGARDAWHLDILAQEAFRDEGVLVSLAQTHLWTERWYTHMGVAAGTGDFLFPRFRADGSVSRKWFPSAWLVTALGATYVHAMDEHRDRALIGSVTAHLAPGFVVEVGGRLNWSDPGGVASERGFVALTVGREGRGYAALRVAGGTEGYQATGPGDAQIDFPSREASLTWRQWVSPGWGTHLVLEVYDNPHYTRAGATAGVFLEW